MVEHFIVKELNGQQHDFSLTFHDDVNIFTGKNGCGKTTLLKLLWYLSSGKLSTAVSEINYKYAELKTDRFFLSIDRTISDNVIISYKTPKVNIKRKVPFQQFIERPFRIIEFIDLYSDIERNGTPTIFFPTFRRIEGGFDNKIENHFRSPISNLKEALVEMSNALSTEKHKFISSISTDDLVSLVTKEYTKISEDTNRIQKQQSDKIISLIKNRRRTNTDAEELLALIQSDIERMENERQEKLMPFSILTDLINRIFHEKGISFVNLALGDIHNIVESDKLSAGEKQMLSFLCYNTFSNGQIIFIDEPELSLHPDWQRILIPTLLNQKNHNQFIIATHSPFIYSKYSDKEFMLDLDKGF